MATASSCPICLLHADLGQAGGLEIGRTDLWLLRHHPEPAPLPGWLLLDARRHLQGPQHFTDREAEGWGPAVRRASQLLRQLSGCDRVYAIAFGEGAHHLHLHLIPRFANDPATAAWGVADLYRAVERGERSPAPTAAVRDLVDRARQMLKSDPLPSGDG